MSYSNSHYAYIEKYGKTLSEDLNVSDITELLIAHGDKCDSYQSSWEKHFIPFSKGVMVYLLTKQKPFDDQVRDTQHGWVDPFEWIKEQYLFKDSAIRIALDKLP